MSIESAFWLFTGFAFAFGAVVGSFLNVVIHRVPAGTSIVSPPSHCPACESKIRWYDNIPILSWILLRAKCRDCETPIPFRYTFVEALTGVLIAGLWYKVAAPHFESAANLAQLPPAALFVPFGAYTLFLCLLVAITFVDLEHFIIPHSFTLPGIGLGLALPWLFEWSLPAGSISGLWPPVTGLESLIGAAVGAFLVVAIYYSYMAIRGVAGIGGGDVTLIALVGAWLGWPALLFVFFASSLQGTIAAGLAHLFGGTFLKPSAEILGVDDEDDRQPDVIESKPEAAEADTPVSTGQSDDTESPLAVPFGPFICLAAVEHFFFGELLPPMLSMSYLYEFGGW